MGKGTFKALRDNLESEAELVTMLLDVAGGNTPEGFRKEMQDFASQTRELAAFIARMETNAISVRIAVVGDFSSGKSSFINSVLQDPALCPERADPTTSLVTTFTYGSEECIHQHHGDGRATTVSRAQYATLVQAPQDGSALAHFTFQLPHPMLKGLELVDTPGFNNRANPADSQVTTGIMKDADAFIYLVDANTGSIAETGLDHVRLIKRESSEAQVFLLISKADQKAPSALERIKARYRDEHAELFDDRILTYSSVEARPGLDTREELAELFQVFQRDKVMLANGTLKRRIRAHQDLRLTCGRPLLEALDQLAKRLEAEIHTKEAILEKIAKRFFVVVEGECEHCFEELAHAVFTHVDPIEIKGSGWFTDDAKIVFSSGQFIQEIFNSSSFDAIEEALRDVVDSLFGNVRQDLHEKTRKKCLAARRKCAQAAESTTCSAWGTDLQMRFESLVKAAERFDAVYKERVFATHEAVWSEWDNCITSLCNDFETEFLVLPSEALNRRREILTAGIDQWKHLIATMPEPKP